MHGKFGRESNKPWRARRNALQSTQPSGIALQQPVRGSPQRNAYVGAGHEVTEAMVDAALAQDSL